jgi:cytochrome c553
MSSNTTLSTRLAPVALLALLTAPATVGDEGQATVESTVLFNTNCARCHEGECSGRMSFHLPREEADQHIRRHGGELPEAQVRELYDLLRYMKEECAF